MTFFNQKKILILSPHTDDAELGCGGLISRLAKENCELLWVVFSTARDSVSKEMNPDVLKNEFLGVAKYLGLNKTNYQIFDFQVRRLNEHRQEVLEILVQLKKEFFPDIVIGPSLNDFHQDHVVVANEMIRAFKTSASILTYELPWNHLKFENQFFVKLSLEEVQEKIKLLHYYQSQFSLKRNYFSNEFIEGLARTRGSQAGCVFAEAFEVIRINV